MSFVRCFVQLLLSVLLFASFWETEVEHPYVFCGIIINNFRSHIIKIQIMKRFIAGFFAVAMVLTLVGFVSAPANAQTMTSAQIMAAIANLQAQLSSMTGGTVTGAQAQAMFNTDLTMGSKNSDVSSLQAVLISNGYSIPAGATGYFGAQTRSALAAWQSATGISPAVGYFGPISRAALNRASGTPVAGTPGTVVCPVGFTCTSTGTGTTVGGITTPGVEGTLTITSAPVSTGTVYEGDSMITALGFKARAQNSDIALQRVKIDLGNSTTVYNKIFSKVYLTDESGATLASMDLNSSNVVKNGSRYEVSLAGFSYVVSKDTTKTLFVKFDVRSSIDSTDLSTGAIISLSTTQAVRGVDGAGIDQFGGDNTITKTLSLSASLSENASLTLTTNTNNPLTQEVIAADGSNNDQLDQVTLLTFDIKADKDNVLLTDLVATITRTNAGAAQTTNASSTFLYAGSTQIGSATAVAGTNNATFADIDYTISKDTTKTFSIRSDIRNASAVQSTITASVASLGLTAENAVGDTIPAVRKSGIATGNPILVRNTGAVFSLVGTPTIMKSQTAGGANGTATSTATATFQLRIKAVGSAITFGTNASATPLVSNAVTATPSFVVYRGGAAITAATLLSNASSTSFTIPSTGVLNNTPVSGSVTVQEDQEITVPVSFTFEGKQVSGTNITTGSYAVGLENINYTTAAGVAQTSSFMLGQTNWRTSEVTLP